MERENDVRLIAYHIWEEQGCCNGRDIDHWLLAETIWEQMREKEKGTARAKPREKVEVTNINPNVKSKTATAEKKGSRQGKKK